MVLCVLPQPIEAPSRSLVIAAGGGRDLAWPHQRVAAELLARSGGRLVHLVLHGGARGADAAIARAADQLGWCSLVMPAQWQLHGRAAGPIRNRELLQQAIARAEGHTSLTCLASVLVVAFPGGPGTASLVQQAQAAVKPKTEPPSALPTAAAQQPADDPGLAPLDPATIRQLHATIRTLPAPVLEGFSKAFRKRFQVPAEAPSIADRICQRRHHDWIETFMVSHR